MDPAARPQSIYSMLWGLTAPARPSASALADQLIASGTTFVTGVIIGRACAKADFGLYLLVFSVITLVTNLQTTLICTPYTFQRHGLSAEDERRYAGTTLVLQCLLAAASVVLVATLAVALPAEWRGTALGSTLKAAALGMWMYMLKEYSRQVAFARLQPTDALVTDAGVAIIQVAGLASLWWQDALSLPRAFFVIGVASGLPTLLFLYRHRRSFEPRWDAVLRDAPRSWSFGRWVLAGFLVSAAATQLMPWAIAAFHGPAATGTFGAALSIATIALPLFTGMSNHLSPRLARTYASRGLDGLRSAIVSPTLIYALGMGLFAMFVIVFGESAMGLIYGGKYLGGEPTLSVLSIAWLAMLVSTPLGLALMAMQRSDVNFRAGLISLLFLVSGGLLLIRLWGALGAAVAILIANVLESGTKLGMYRSLLGAPRHDRTPRSTDVLPDL